MGRSLSGKGGAEGGFHVATGDKAQAPVSPNLLSKTDSVSLLRKWVPCSLSPPAVGLYGVRGHCVGGHRGSPKSGDLKEPGLNPRAVLRDARISQLSQTSVSPWSGLSVPPGSRFYCVFGVLHVFNSKTTDTGNPAPHRGTCLASVRT